GKINQSGNQYIIKAQQEGYLTVVNDKNNFLIKEVNILDDAVYSLRNSNINKPIINARNIKIQIGEELNILNDVTASDKQDGDITSRIIVKGTVNTKKTGEYKVIYIVKDNDDNEVMKEITVIVEAKELQPSSGGGNVISKPTIISNKIVGDNRYDTAIKISNRGWNKADNVLIVNSTSIVDALSATPFGKLKNAPIILTEVQGLSSESKNEIVRLQAKNAYIIGGEGVVSENVVLQLEELGINVERIGGDDRYKTSLEIAKKLKNISKIAVVNGVNGLSDAVSIAPVTANENMPIVLSSPSEGTKVFNEFINNNNIESSYIIGGQGVISEDIKNKLPNSKRLGGENRNETNNIIIKEFYSNENLNNIFVTKNGLNKEEDLIDALSVGILAAREQSPVVIVGNNLDENQKDILSKKKPKEITQVGGGGNERAFKQLLNIFK
uniref:cell wall-binding repeat-containing protein n=1 Tax=Clostridium ihumii TaxID=1470356 RepID=UPI0011DD771D